jgi:predicted  nucleic acid-binding Zn-ribbon protein
MPATETICRNCQASADAAEQRHGTRVYAAGQVPETGRSAAQTREAAAVVNPHRIAELAIPPRAFPRRLPVLPLIAIAVLGVVAVIYAVNLHGRRQAYLQKLAGYQGLVAAAQQRFDEARKTLDDAAGRVEQAERAVARARNDVADAQKKLEQLQEEQQSVERATPVRVLAHAWTVQLEIEQCDARQGEGWNYPPDAFDVKSEPRVHHHEQVLDRVETLFRTEHYQAQDGFDTEVYTERVAAGTRQVPDGYDIEDLGNGRFRKTPKFRTETIYEDVTKTRQKPRMVTKTRQIPYENKVYRQDPVRQPWYTYRTKIWNPSQPMSRSGEGLEVLDPEGRPPQNAGSELGARRVRERRVSCSLTLQPLAPDSPPCTVAVPEARWRSFADGSTALLAKNEPFTPEEQQARLASFRSRIEQATVQIVELTAKVPPLVDRIDPLRQQLPPLKETLGKLQTELSAEKQQLQAVVTQGY